MVRGHGPEMWGRASTSPGHGSKVQCHGSTSPGHSHDDAFHIPAGPFRGRNRPFHRPNRRGRGPVGPGRVEVYGSGGVSRDCFGASILPSSVLASKRL
jgi:hypothetical protein